MISELANGLLVLALVSCVYGMGAAILSVKKNSLAWAESARITLLVNGFLISCTYLLANFEIWFNQTHVKLVYEATSAGMPPTLKLAAITNNGYGIILMWVWFISLVGLFFGMQHWSGSRDQQSWAIALFLGLFAGILILLVGFQNPFLRMWVVHKGEIVLSVLRPEGTRLFCPPSGIGEIPVNFNWPQWLQLPLILFSGASISASYVFIMVYLVSGKAGETDLERSLPFSFGAWLALLVAGLLEMVRSYLFQPEMGVWNWTRYQTSLLIPLLLLTALLHNLTVHRNRGLFRHLAMTLTTASFFAVQFLIVSQLPEQDTQTSKDWLLACLTGMAMISTGLLVWRWKKIRSHERIESVASKEALSLVGILILTSLAVVCVWGIGGPRMVNSLIGANFSFGPDQYRDAMAGPASAILIVLGLVPFSAWRYSNGLNLAYGAWRPLAISLLIIILITIFGLRYQPAIIGFWLILFGLISTFFALWNKIKAVAFIKQIHFRTALLEVMTKNHHRYGAYLVHIGLLFLAVSVIGIEMLTQKEQGRLRFGESLTSGSFEYVFRGATTDSLAAKIQTVTADVEIVRNGQSLVHVFPKVNYYSDQSLKSYSGRYSSIRGDAYVMLADRLPATSDSAILRVFYSPLVNWFWVGAALMLLGSIMLMVGRRGFRNNAIDRDRTVLIRSRTE